MLKAIIGGLCGTVLFSGAAMAANCSPYTYTFSNGSTADATQVNSNFSNIINCANNLAPLTNPQFVGQLGIGVAPTNALHIMQNQDSPSIMYLFNGNNTANARAELRLQGSGGLAQLIHTSGSYTPANVIRANGTILIGGGSGGLTLNTGTAQPIYFAINNAEVARFDASGRLGIGTTTPGETLEVNGRIKVNTLASASATDLCHNGNVLSSCSSSIRYKEKVKSGTFGLNEIMKLRPVTFKWKGRDENDLGFIAEEVEKINPLFATYKNGQIEGVKYPQLTAVLANAVRELKAANDKVAAENTELKSRLDKNEQRLAELELRAGIRTAANDNLLTKVAAVFGW